MKAQNTITMSTQLGSNMTKVQNIQAKEQLIVRSKITIKKGLQIVIKWKKNVHIFKLPYIKTFVFHSHALVEFSNISWFLGLIKII
jgi:hypothetical protein